jgi:hypothetical protein
MTAHGQHLLHAVRFGMSGLRFLISVCKLLPSHSSFFSLEQAMCKKSLPEVLHRPMSILMPQALDVQGTGNTVASVFGG